MEAKETAALTKRPSTETLLTFIRNYRIMETSTYESGFSILYCAFARPNEDPFSVKHVIQQWKVKEKGFGQFFLNKLSRRRMILLLNYWGILDENDQLYLKACDDNPQHQFFNDAPETVTQIFKMVLFFENHGLTEVPIDGMRLVSLPGFKRCYGNSANWGDYILTLPNPDEFFDSLYSNYNG